MAARGYYGGDDSDRNPPRGYGNQRYGQDQYEDPGDDRRHYGNDPYGNHQRYGNQDRREEYGQQEEYSQGYSGERHNQMRRRQEGEYGDQYGQGQNNYDQPHHGREQSGQQYQQQQQHSYGGFNKGRTQYEDRQSRGENKQHSNTEPEGRVSGNSVRLDNGLYFGYGSGAEPPNPTGDRSLPSDPSHGVATSATDSGSSAAYGAGRHPQESQARREGASFGQSATGHSASPQSRAPPNMRGNFSGSSRDINLRGSTLSARCTDVSGNARKSEIDLNDVFTNEWGSLKWKRGGNFAGSARNLRLVSDGKALECELGDGQGGWQRNTIYLDERIGNDNGNLVFVD